MCLLSDDCRCFNITVLSVSAGRSVASHHGTTLCALPSPILPVNLLSLLVSCFRALLLSRLAINLTLRNGFLMLIIAMLFIHLNFCSWRTKCIPTFSGSFSSPKATVLIICFLTWIAIFFLPSNHQYNSFLLLVIGKRVIPWIQVPPFSHKMISCLSATVTRVYNSAEVFETLVWKGRLA